MRAPTYFEDFIENIRLPDGLRAKAQRAHTRLRELIESDTQLKPLIVATFLQGSYKRHTGVKPEPGKRCDVDVVVVTTLDRRATSPQEALNLFKPFLEKHYKGQYRAQGRSWRIIDGDIELDLVPTASASVAMTKFLNEAGRLDFLSDLGDFSRDLERMQELRESEREGSWRTDVLFIPDRESKVWRETNPLAQIDWTIAKNEATNSHYVNVVKATKWWRKTAYDAKHPKGYPLEHLVGANCPDGIDSVAQGFALATQSIVADYSRHRAAGIVPSLQDHGVQSHNVLGRLSFREFQEFYDEVTVVSQEARVAFDEPDMGKSVSLWRGIFGDEFPEPTRYTEPTAPSHVLPGRFA